MTQADRIRQFALDHYISRARAEGHAEVTVRAGDVHRRMGLRNAMPAVCSAIGSQKFLQLAQVTLRDRVGPANGANVYFTFDLSASPQVHRRAAAGREPLVTQHPMVKPEPVIKHRPALPTSDLDLRDALVLVSCVKTKLPYPAPASALYTSALFQNAREFVEARGLRWFILSALHGLVDPATVIAPYEYTLNNVGVAERRAWADRVLEKLVPETVDSRRVVMFAGQRYREFLIEPLMRQRIVVDVPLAHLRLGEQLAWLSDHK